MNANFIINNDRIEIPSSKMKLSLLLLGSILFVFGGILFILHPSEFQGKPLHNRPEWLILTVGYSSVIFFATCGVVTILQLFNSKPGLIIDKNGITIPGLRSTAFVSWDMILRFDIINISRTKLVGIYLKNPNGYINSLTNSTARKLALFSLNNYDTPLSISTNSLKCNTHELLVFLQEKLEKSEIEISKSEIK